MTQNKLAVTETREIHCDQAIDFLVEELRSLEQPFEIRISPITEYASESQKGLWNIWLTLLAKETGQPRRELEQQALAKYGVIREFDTGSCIEFRPTEFARLTIDQASLVMGAVQAEASEFNVILSIRS